MQPRRAEGNTMNDKAKLDPEMTHAPDEDIPEKLDDQSLTDVIRDIDESMKRRETGPKKPKVDTEKAPDDDLGYVVPED
jgi:hypothetical protein